MPQFKTNRTVFVKPQLDIKSVPFERQKICNFNLITKILTFYVEIRSLEKSFFLFRDQTQCVF